MKRRVIQFALGGEGNAELWVLCDDGTMWRRSRVPQGSSFILAWSQVSLDYPQPA